MIGIAARLGGWVGGVAEDEGMSYKSEVGRDGVGIGLRMLIRLRLDESLLVYIMNVI